MKKNINSMDRNIRLIIAGLIGLFYWQGVIEGILAYILFAVAAILVITSFINFCPLYAIFGINTCKIKKK